MRVVRLTGVICPDERLARLLPLLISFLRFRREYGRGWETDMDGTYGVICFMCGRDLGCVVQGRYFARPGTATLQRAGRQFRCGYCHGSVLFEADASLSQPDWIAAMRREEEAGGGARRTYRRRAG